MYFKLTLARPVETAMTMARTKRVEKGVALAGGGEGSREAALSRPIRSQLTT